MTPTPSSRRKTDRLLASRPTSDHTPAVLPFDRGGSVVARGTENLTLDRMIAGDLAVDHWLKVNQFGLFIDTNRTPLKTLKLALPLDEIVATRQIKAGHPVKYWKTLDGATCITGGSWADAVAEAQLLDPRARDYRSADLPFVALSDIVSPDGELLASKDERIGHSLSTTGWQSFSRFLRRLRKDQHSLGRGTVHITLGFKALSHGPNCWGVLDFSNYEVMA